MTIKIITASLLILILSGCSTISTSSGPYRDDLTRAANNIEQVISPSNSSTMRQVFALPFYVVGVTSVGIACLLGSVPDECQSDCTSEQIKNDGRRMLYTLGFGALGMASMTLGSAIEGK